MAHTDVFISYTHRDNYRLTGEQQGWIDRFHEALAARLNALCGRDARIWRDEKIGGADLLTPAIAAAIDESTILVSVLSPSYLNSEWCAKELQLFVAAAQRTGDLKAGTKSRIVKVLKTPIARETALADTPELSESIGYEFYRLNAQGVPHEFDPRLGTDPYQEFLGRVNELAYGLSKVLEHVAGAATPAEVVPPSGKTIYLASTSYDLCGESDRLRRELEQFGHTVVPHTAIPLLPGYQQRVRAILAQCDLSIHPVGAGYGAIPEGDDRSVVELQYLAAGEESALRPGFIRVPWMPPERSAHDERQTAFITALGEDPRLLIMPLEGLKTTIADLLKPAPPAKRVIAPAAGESIYFIYDPSDAAAAAPIEDALFEAGFEVTHPLTGGDEHDVRADHQENLTVCDAVLIYYGNPNEFWLRTKLRDVQKAFGYGRGRPFAARGVLLADPVRTDKDAFRSRDVLALNGYGPFRPAMLDPFLARLAHSGNTAM